MKEVPVAEAATILNVTTEHVRRLINQKRLSAHKFGSQWLVDGESLRRYGARRGPDRGSPARKEVRELACKIFSRIAPSDDIDDLILMLRICFLFRPLEIRDLICSWNDDLNHADVARKISRVCDGR